MTVRITLATAARVLTQLARDRRTIGLVLVVPTLLVTLLKYVLGGNEAAFDRIAAPMLGLFPAIIMFLIASITVLRERTSGTLERLLTTPLGKLDLLLGYGIAFAALAVVQASVVAGVGLGLLGVDVAGSLWAVVVLAVANAVLGMALGLFVSAFAATEFQAVQFLPALIFPQLIVCGLLVPREQMSAGLEAASDALPLTYAFDGLQRIALDGSFDAMVWRDLGIVIGSALLALALGATTLRRRTA